MIDPNTPPAGSAGIVATQRPPPTGEKAIWPTPDGWCSASTTVAAVPPPTCTATWTDWVQSGWAGDTAAPDTESDDEGGGEEPGP